MTPHLQEVADPSAGLAREDRLFGAAGSHIYMWASRAQGLVCPRAYQRKTGFGQAARNSANSGWPVHLRGSGGGAVPQGPGVINLALVFDAPIGFTLEDGYRNLIGVLKQGLGPRANQLAPGTVANSFCDGKWNLSCAGKKVVGTAQRWRAAKSGNPRILAHALILIDDRFQAGTDSVATFHSALGLPPVDRRAHASLQSVLQTKHLPTDAWHSAAKDAFATLQESQTGQIETGGKPCPTKRSTSTLKSQCQTPIGLAS